jgi:hypothetical protein
VLGVTLVEVQGRSGRVVHDLVGGLRLTPTSLWGRLVIAVAGIAAEFRAGKRVRALDCHGDLTRARECAQELVRQCDVFDALPFDTDGKRAIVQMLIEELTPGEAHAVEAAYYKAKVLLGCYDREWRLLSLVLFVCGSLDTRDLWTLLAPRQHDRVFVLRRERGWWRKLPGRVLALMISRIKRRVKGWWTGDGATDIAKG